MAKAKIDAGNCGYHTTVEALASAEYQVDIKIESDCKHIQKLAENLTEVDALNEISFRKGKHIPEIIQAGINHCTHAACPVPVGILKAVEVAAGLALPQDATIELEGRCSIH